LKSDIEPFYIQVGTLIYELQALRRDMADGTITDKDKAIKRYLEIIEEYGPKEEK